MLGAKRKNFLVRITVFVLLAAMIPTLCASMIIHRDYSGNIKDDLLEANTRYIRQTVNAMELVMKQVNNTWVQLSIRTSTIFPLSPTPSIMKI